MLFGMKGELSTPMMKKNPTSDVIEVLQGKSGEKKEPYATKKTKNWKTSLNKASKTPSIIVFPAYE